ncbi:MAG: aldehyde dehydrogenase family protein [Robiginitomaculum sp.]|nr:MAG: aldehyde dehydrogenase family protein [Robiginitomaculum sp.]
MPNTEKFYINGKWITPQSDRRTEVINPATLQPAGKIALGSKEDAEMAIAAARNAFDDYSTWSCEQRLDLMGSILSVYQRRIGEIAAAISTEMGAPLKNLAEPAQAATMLGHLEINMNILKHYQFHEDQGSTRIQREPIGVCGMITPWNWPIHQIGAKVAPALAAGCTMVLKPSELAPLSAILFAEIMDEAGVPAGVFNLVNGDGPTVGSVLASHPDIDFVSFTGSTRAGVLVSEAAAPTVKKVALELGGKSANILLEDADFETSVPEGVAAMLMNSGQNCNAPSRMLVPRTRLAEVEELAKAAMKVVVGDPVAEDTAMGPLANKPQFKKVQSMIQKGIDEGGKVICGGVGKPDGLDQGYFAKPTIFSNVTNDMAIAREEIFGPVLCILPYDSEDDAVSIANDSDYGLSGYVSSNDRARAKAVAAKLRTGNVHLNGADPDFMGAFGGYKKSGLGREWGKFGFEEYLEVKTIFGHNDGV